MVVVLCPLLHFLNLLGGRKLAESGSAVSLIWEVTFMMVHNLHNACCPYTQFYLQFKMYDFLICFISFILLCFSFHSGFSLLDHRLSWDPSLSLLAIVTHSIRLDLDLRPPGISAFPLLPLSPHVCVCFLFSPICVNDVLVEHVLTSCSWIERENVECFWRPFHHVKHP